MRPTEFLKSQCQSNWDAATAHAFTDALCDGTLDLDKMRGYLQQDYLFVEEFVRLLAAAISNAPSLTDAVPAAQFLAVITGPENTYFQRSLAALDAPEAEAAAPQTQAFLIQMRDARLTGKYEEMLAVLVVAEWTYLSWAAPQEKRAAGLPFYFGEWITLHAGPGFEGVVEYLRGQLDAIWPSLSDTAQTAATQRFFDTVQLERAFFDAAWAGFEVAR
ncbi:TENA/THI-4 family protein [Epibacterium sp. SM1979]|uniref:Aminopyrimidine aminohydrolase n=1 Tax=Tritonibacter litoralis TaxID=2662264 RepID=A0A843YCP4_9RHOB|nr:TenA family protein [Tritonibacter litoralis]MQQ06829.1 TENA/THI-4 family protein [Tritonibacter litoralis]